MIQMEGEVVDLKPIGCMCNLFIIIKNKNKKILWLPVLMACLDRGGWKEKRKGEEVAGMYCVSVHPSLFHFFPSSFLFPHLFFCKHWDRLAGILMECLFG